MKLFRISNVLSLAVATVFGILLFWTSQAVQKKESDLSQDKQALRQEQETIRVLSVEWDYLNRPQRLEKLAKEQLGMQLPSAQEVVSGVEDIPEPILPAVMPEDPVAQEAAPKAISIDYDTAYPTTARVQKRPEIVKPSSAEKQSFEKLIQSLDTSAGGGE